MQINEIKSLSRRSIYLCILLLVALYQPAYSQGSHPNNITIRNDRVFTLNGKPFFPVGVCFELGKSAYDEDMKKPNGNGTYGFNFINLFSQNSNLYYCFGSRNMMSGDMSSGSQFTSILGAYWDPNITVNSNYARISSYLDDGVYLMSDNFAFFANDITHWAWTNPSPCADSIVLNPTFSQQVREQAIDRVNNLAESNNSRVIGFYSLDDANMFQGQGPNPPMYYYNNFRQTRIDNLQSGYNYAQQVYPNSIVLMSLPPVYFPRVFDYNNWLDVNAARNAWVTDAIELTRGANVLFTPGYLSMVNWGDPALIYENGYPKWYPRHIKETLIDRVLSASPTPKALLGGIIFDIPYSNPLWNDPKLTEKAKWEIYVGLEKGATGLIFFGWHKRNEEFFDSSSGLMVKYRPIWDVIRHQVDTIVNVKHFDSVFVKTNLGEIGYTLNVPDSADVSYAIYKKSGDSWLDYYMLVTNNPLGSLYGPDEGTKNVVFNCNAHQFKNYNITEEFSGKPVPKTGQNTFSYSLPWFGTAMFHIYIPGSSPIVPGDFYLKQNYPNPFNPSTQINFGLKTDAFVTVRIYNLLGQQVRTLLSETRAAGEYTITFDGSDLASGIYFCKMSAGGFDQTKKMLLVK